MSPPDLILNDYTDITACTCSYCSEVCQAPAVDHYIGFWDGFNFKTVGWSYIGFIAFTIIF